MEEARMRTEMPKRLAEARRTSRELSRKLSEAHTVFCGEGDAASAESRNDCESVTINSWTNAQGRHCVEVVSDHEMTVLEAKGLLHDAVYALAHADDFVGATSA